MSWSSRASRGGDVIGSTDSANPGTDSPRSARPPASPAEALAVAGRPWHYSWLAMMAAAASLTFITRRSESGMRRNPW